MKRLSKVLTMGLTLVMVLSLVACAGKTSSEPKPDDTSKQAEQKAEVKKDLVVAGVVFQEDQFMKLLTLGYEDAAKAAGVKCLTGNTGNDQAKEFFV